jgi:hypothetical protein
MTEFERRLEAHLRAEARPIPIEVVDAVVAQVPRERQIGPLGEWRRRFGRLVVSAAAAAALIATVVFGPGLVGQSVSGPAGASSKAPSVTPSVPPTDAPAASASTTLEWDGVLGFREYPSQTNPAMDSYGHPSVWYYLHGPAGSRDPVAYVPFEEFDAVRDGWIDRDRPGLFVGFTLGDDELTLVPSVDAAAGDHEAAIVAWRSPIDVAVEASGRVEVDGVCGDGVVFWIDQGINEIETVSLANGAHEFSFVADVRSGETIFFGVESGPAGDAKCDTTWLRVVIRGT